MKTDLNINKMDRKLYRDDFHKKIGGVCAGLAEYFNIDVTIIRVIFVLALIFHGGGFLIYVILWIVLPKKPFIINPNVDYRVPPSPNPGDNANQFGGSPYTANAYANQPPYPNQPYPVQPRNSTSLVAIVFGVVLILIGGTILLDDFDILPDWDFERLWPVILIVVGCAIMISGERKKPWDNAEWNKANTTEDKPADDTASEATPPADNAPTV